MQLRLAARSLDFCLADRLEGGRRVGFLVRRSDGDLNIFEAYRALNVVQSDIQHRCTMGDPAD
jgi:hypothetical protein